ncbi:hypothetical protein AVEN_184893-1 [Araneus ventricosus]|uniref:Uncharacterized protein n=1 Tax=Araneus ventricosus TaxID=182803 RepID=A0A4Y2GCN0_ARAVE|nr:hypothetical protein AVEN_184893-1 [Araneus ventricosus]
MPVRFPNVPLNEAYPSVFQREYHRGILAFDQKTSLLKSVQLLTFLVLFSVLFGIPFPTPFLNVGKKSVPVKSFPSFTQSFYDSKMSSTCAVMSLS